MIPDRHGNGLVIGLWHFASHFNARLLDLRRLSILSCLSNTPGGRDDRVILWFAHTSDLWRKTACLGKDVCSKKHFTWYYFSKHQSLDLRNWVFLHPVLFLGSWKEILLSSPSISFTLSSIHSWWIQSSIVHELTSSYFSPPLIHLPLISGMPLKTESDVRSTQGTLTFLFLSLSWIQKRSL